MNGTIIAEHLASFSENAGPLSINSVKDKLRSSTYEKMSKSMQCCFNISAEKLLELRFVNSGRPCEQFDLRFVTDIAAFSSQKLRSVNPYILVFRYLAKELTNGSSYNELHVFKLESEADLLLAVSSLKEEVASIKPKQPRRISKRRLLRESLNMSDIVERTEVQEQSLKPQSGRRDLLAKTNRLLEKIQSFENRLKSILNEDEIHTKTEATNGQAIIKQEDAADHIRCIRKGLNNLSQLIEVVDKSELEKISTKMFKSLRWIKSVGDSKKIRQIHPLLLTYVKTPTLTNEAVLFLESRLRKEDTVFWKSLGESWTKGGSRNQENSMESESEESEFESMESCSTLIPSPARFGRRPTGDDLFKEITAALPISNPRTELQPQSESAEHFVNNGPRVSFFASFTEENFINSIRHRGKLVARIVKRHVGRDRAELSVNEGDVLEILDLGEQWGCLRTATAVAGHVPISCIQILPEDNEINGNSVLLTPNNGASQLPRPTKPDLHRDISSELGMI